MKRPFWLSAALATVVIAVGCSSSDTGGSFATTTDAAVSDDSGLVIPDLNDASTSADRPAAPTCEDYCADAERACSDGNALYRSVDECLSVCATMPRGTVGDRSGDTLACRDYYASGPARTDATRCPVAGPWGGEVCGTRCESFCRAASTACPGAYESIAGCIKTCAATPGISWDPTASDGANGPETGDTLNCRATWLQRAFLDSSACEGVALDSKRCR